MHHHHHRDEPLIAKRVLQPSGKLDPNLLSLFSHRLRLYEYRPSWRGYRAVERGAPICSEGIDQYGLFLTGHLSHALTFYCCREAAALPLLSQTVI